jgi:hypothetical protein
VCVPANSIWCSSTGHEHAMRVLSVLN